MKHTMGILMSAIVVCLFFTSCTPESTSTNKSDTFSTSTTSTEITNMTENPIEENTVTNGTTTETVSTTSGSLEMQKEIWRENSVEVVNSAKEELTGKGWGDLDAFEGEVDYKAQYGVSLEPTNTDENAVLYTVLGKVDGKNNNPITVIIQYLFSADSPKGKLVNVIYISKSGRNSIGDDYFENNKIVDADDRELWNLMYSY